MDEKEKVHSVKALLSITLCLNCIACAASVGDLNSTFIQQSCSVQIPAKFSRNIQQNRQMTDAVIDLKTVYYLGSPQQSRPPEGVFSAGTRVTIEKENGHYLMVTDENGVTAWVSAKGVSTECETKERDISDTE